MGKVTDFSSFLSQPAPSAKTAGYSDFQAKMWHGVGGEGIEGAGIGIVDPQPFAHIGGLDDALKTLNNISGMLGKLKDGSMDALQSLKQEFQVQNDTQKVVFPPSFVEFMAQKAQREDGTPPSEFNIKNVKFGAQTITSPEQLARLQKDVEGMKEKYGEVFGNMELNVIKYDDGKQVAVVTGLEDVALFNSVRAAEAKQRELGQTVQAALSPEGKAPQQQPQQEASVEANVMNMGNKVEQLAALYSKPGQSAEAPPPPNESALVSPLPAYTAGKIKSGGGVGGPAAA